jgi:hypothetical protein
MTNPDHAERALAYDIPVGVCHIESDDMRLFRQMADWRYLKGLNKNNDASKFFEYFGFGIFKDGSVYEWAKNDDEGKIPKEIVNETNMFGI